MTAYIVTVSKVEDGKSEAATIVDGVQREIYRQTLEELDLAKFVVALNKAPRKRAAKAKEGK